jgi:hypothetical protein
MVGEREGEGGGAQPTAQLRVGGGCLATLERANINARGRYRLHVATIHTYEQRANRQR